MYTNLKYLVNYNLMCIMQYGKFLRLLDIKDIQISSIMKSWRGIKVGL